MNSNSSFAILVLAIAAMAAFGNAFSIGPSPFVVSNYNYNYNSKQHRVGGVPNKRRRRLSMASDTGVADDDDKTEEEEEEMVTVRSIAFVVDSKPLGIVLEELGDGVGVFVAECDPDGSAYEAGLRDGDVLASLDGDEAISNASIDDAMVLLGQAFTPLPVGVYRELLQAQENAAAAPRGNNRGTVKMAPRRLPSTKKLLKASTNANFWSDPLMIGSAVLTVAMPLGIFLASKGMS